MRSESAAVYSYYDYLYNKNLRKDAFKELFDLVKQIKKTRFQKSDYVYIDDLEIAIAKTLAMFQAIPLDKYLSSQGDYGHNIFQRKLLTHYLKSLTEQKDGLKLAPCIFIIRVLALMFYEKDNIVNFQYRIKYKDIEENISNLEPILYKNKYLSYFDKEMPDASILIYPLNHGEIDININWLQMINQIIPERLKHYLNKSESRDEYIKFLNYFVTNNYSSMIGEFLNQITTEAIKDHVSETTPIATIEVATPVEKPTNSNIDILNQKYDELLEKHNALEKKVDDFIGNQEPHQDEDEYSFDIEV
jgi:hypothetical protein